MSGIPRVLSIAGTDPTGGAGIQADLKAIAANGGYGMAVITSLVAQNTQGVRSIHLPPTSFLREQLDAVSDDVTIDAVKIGMLATDDVVAEVAAWLRRIRPPIVVLDPVMVATSGDRLLDERAEAAVRDLLAEVDIVTPNLPELAVLAACPVALTWPEAIRQARAVSARHDVIVLAKGGHLGGQGSPDALVDAAAGLSGGHDLVEFVQERVPTTNTHGTGCSLSSALATRQARLGDWVAALASAKEWLTDSLRHADELDVGHGNGPIHHFAALWSAGDAAAAASVAASSVATVSFAEVSVADAVTPVAALGADMAAHTEEWWAGIDHLRTEIDDLAFIRGLADGSLADDAFSAYIAQDALYLRDYSRALARASQLAPTVAEQAFWASSAHGCLVEELELHRTWLDGRATDAAPSAVTTAYLNHLLAAAQGGSYPVLVAALLPCFWIYQDVGERLAAANHAEHPYRTWLDCYAQPDFQAVTLGAIAIVERAAQGATAPERAEMRRSFHASAEHELAFFDQTT
ncbi:bifunctional hydroxymethylpyrimidine kinase/phosphomethylpyrimidine kinase [Cryobacterium mannosilyticum]|uniref:Bifunctional hydroxymethylpyrimidine kinase/phosphomethylpyrimidine kinase n=1 Tax=Cryobacterium mannosilyticum TaxID=1259190 RepID=A0A4R8WDK9_9MICO|nr:bifunctional hydroxymethylpyrimidine kinase/phosphomethylpyrimidine kinase [Cryobacterium mannosilyticum]TFC05389.1 bifunctional hydroxymethylpyrimidine kinase/phosphomethylpyrimidine kinase [Cryobacterium mannosilyticum]